MVIFYINLIIFQLRKVLIIMKTNALILILFSLMIMLQTSCFPKRTPTKVSEPNPDEPFKFQIEREMVSVFELNDKKFQIKNTTLSQQTNLIGHNILALSFDLPKIADYAEIIRCDSNVNLGLNTIGLGDLSEIIVANTTGEIFEDYFKAAENHPDCILVSTGTKIRPNDFFYDPQAPNGNYRYLVRSCVFPQRIKDTEHYTKKNCSRQIGISNEFMEYKNKSMIKIQKFHRLYQYYSSKFNNILLPISWMSKLAIESLDHCEKINHQKIVDKKIRDAWINIATAIVEIGYEFYSIKRIEGKILKHYAKVTSPRSIMDLAQLVNATTGGLLSLPITMVLGSANDMPVSCSEYSKIVNEVSIAYTKANIYNTKKIYYNNLKEMYSAYKDERIIPDPVSIVNIRDTTDPTDVEVDEVEIEKYFENLEY